MTTMTNTTFARGPAPRFRSCAWMVTMLIGVMAADTAAAYPGAWVAAGSCQLGVQNGLQRMYTWQSAEGPFYYNTLPSGYAQCPLQLADGTQYSYLGMWYKHWESPASDDCYVELRVLRTSYATGATTEWCSIQSQPSAGDFGFSYSGCSITADSDAYAYTLEIWTADDGLIACGTQYWGGGLWR